MTRTSAGEPVPATAGYDFVPRSGGQVCGDQRCGRRGVGRLWVGGASGFVPDQRAARRCKATRRAFGCSRANLAFLALSKRITANYESKDFVGQEVALLFVLARNESLIQHSSGASYPFRGGGSLGVWVWVVGLTNKAAGRVLPGKGRCGAFRLELTATLAFWLLLSAVCTTVPLQQQRLVSKPNMVFSESSVFDYTNRLLPQTEPGSAGFCGVQGSGCTSCK